MNLREWALPVYTILMQIAVGALFTLWVIRWLARPRFSAADIDRVIRNPLLVILFTTVVAIFGAHFHLSRPFHSFLAVLNFQRSWLSREIVFTVLFATTTGITWYLSRYHTARPAAASGAGWLAVLWGFTVVYCMASIYLLPTQVAWNSPAVIMSFFVTTLLLGGMTIACLMVLDLTFAEIQKSDDIDLRIAIIQHAFAGLTLTAFALVLSDITLTLVQILLLQQGNTAARVSLDLLFGLYLPLLIIRIALLVYASSMLGVAVYRMYRMRIAPQAMMLPVYLSCLLIFIGEIIGRFLFYATHVRIGL